MQYILDVFEAIQFFKNQNGKSKNTFNERCLSRLWICILSFAIQKMEQSK